MIGLFWIILLFTNVVSYGFDYPCPSEWECACIDGEDIELHCSPANESSGYIVNVQPNEYVKIQCRNHPKWSSFRVSNMLVKNDIKDLRFKMCDLPTNSSLADIAGQLGTYENITKLIFLSYHNLNDTLTRNHLRGFSNLKELLLSNNGLTNLESDLFAYVPRLVQLELRENNIILSPGIFNYTPELKVLELGNNMMKRIEPGIFDPLTKLMQLNLWRNTFTELDQGIFDNLIALSILDLNSNKLVTLPEDIFAKLTNLSVLSLHNNNFISLPDGLLKHNAKLTVVKLFSNKRDIVLPRKFFANLTRLETVKLYKNGILNVPEDLFWGCTSLQNVSLAHNQLVSLPKHLFEGLKKLYVLELQHNHLRSLPDGIFSDATNLNVLDLGWNRLTSISKDLFSELKLLTVLNMQHNQLQAVDYRSFANLVNLQVANFANNQLVFASPFKDQWGTFSVFNKCNNLEELYLSNNSIPMIYLDWIMTKSLRILDLKYNNIASLHTDDLLFFSNVIEVDLRHNLIKHINLEDIETTLNQQQNSYRDVKILIQDNPIICDCFLYKFLLYLEEKLPKNVLNYFRIDPGNLTCHDPKLLKNKIVTEIKSESFICLSSDECPSECSCSVKRADNEYIVDCSNKNLSSIPRNIPRIPNQSLVLNLTGNLLTQMTPLDELGLEQASISQLLLANNTIHDVSVKQLPRTVKILELHGNNIDKLDSDVLQFLGNSTNLKRLTLHGNPWTCDCNAKDFLNFIQTKTRIISKSTLIECKDSKASVLKMTVTDLCPMDTVLIVGTSFAIAIIGLIIGTLMALYYRYQREIKVWLYAHNLCLWLVTETELDKHKLYDAFISYSHKDEDFVVEELVKKLESGPRPYKLCLHYRDWLVGEWIPLQITKSVEASRRTIVVLSPNFMESVWGRMEFRVAHCQALNEGKARVILVLYGDIGSIDHLDPDFQAYMKMNTYVKWGDPWFWDKLRYALPHPELKKMTKKSMKSIKPKIFDQQQQHCIQINGDKKELVTVTDGPETPPATSTPPADAVKVFICDEKNDKDKKDDIERVNALDDTLLFPTKQVLESEKLIKQNFIENVQSTTV